MDSENNKEGQYMQRPPLFEANCFIYWKNYFETYMKSKDIDLWHIIVSGDYKPTIKNKDTEKDEIIPYEKFEETHKKVISKKDEAKMWRPKVTAIEESKDLLTLHLDELIGNLKVYEVVLEKDSEASKFKKEKYQYLALKARKVSSDEEESCSGSDEEYAMAIRDFKKFFRRRGKFVRQPHDDKKSFRKIKEEKKGKEDQRCFKCGDPNHFISDCPKHSFNDQNHSLEDVGLKVMKKTNPRGMRFISWLLTIMRVWNMVDTAYPDTWIRRIRGFLE
ncbi:zf-CCHC domain-containing protein [Tanacetum coccineum]